MTSHIHPQDHKQLPVPVFWFMNGFSCQPPSCALSVLDLWDENVILKWLRQPPCTSHPFVRDSVITLHPQTTPISQASTHRTSYLIVAFVVALLWCCCCSFIVAIVASHHCSVIIIVLSLPLRCCLCCCIVTVLSLPCGVIICYAQTLVHL